MHQVRYGAGGAPSDQAQGLWVLFSKDSDRGIARE